MPKIARRMKTEQNTQHNEPVSAAGTNTVSPDTTITDTGAAQADAGTTDTAAAPTGAGWAWTAIVLAILAWVLLMVSNGYVAITAGGVATVMSIVALCRSYGAMHRLAVTALIASLVLVVVLGAFIMVIKVGLG